MFIGDDDSSMKAKIREEVDYNVEKWSDTTHATKTLVSHLHKISAQKQSCPGESPLSHHQRSLNTSRNVSATA